MGTDRENIIQTLRRLVRLYANEARLTATEKITLLLSGIAFFSIVLIIGAVAMVFLAMSVSDLLGAAVGAIWAHLIVTGIFILLIVLLAVFRTQLLVDPIARFVSKLIINPSDKGHEQDNEES